jgi:hypothetical protein
MTYLEASYLPFRVNGRSGGFRGSVSPNPNLLSHLMIMTACKDQLLAKLAQGYVIHPYCFSLSAQELKN